MQFKIIFFSFLLFFCCVYEQTLAQATAGKIEYQPIESSVIKGNFSTKNKKSLFAKLLNNHSYLLAGMNFNKQTISNNGYQSGFNYDLSTYQKNIFKPAYFLGYRWESENKNNHLFAFSLLFHKIVTGSNYTENNKLSPFINNFTKFLAEDQFILLDVATYYKQLIPIGDTSKYKLYFTIGPSLNFRLSEQSEDNLINDNYNRYYISGDGGLEFNNQSFYTLFVHYKYALNSFTRAPIVTNLNSVEMGAMIKLKDIF